MTSFHQTSSTDHKKEVIYPVLLAGGVGSRLWPLSTKQRPKQFIYLFDGKSLFQITIQRFINNKSYGKPLIMTNSSYEKYVKEQLEELDIHEYDILYEPACKDTGPAILLATEYLYHKYKYDVNILLVPADHYIPNSKKLLEYVNHGLQHIESNVLIFGINPTSPETGYGYIKKGNVIDKYCFNVSEFKEKPNLQKAKEYLKSGNYYWNSGIYLFTASNLINSFKNHCFDVYSDMNSINFLENSEDLFTLQSNLDIFQNVKSISIDYAITEKIDNIVMINTDVEWSDVGSWKGLWDISEKDLEGNVLKKDLHLFYSKNNLIRTNKPIVMIGVQNLAIVETEDMIMILNKDYSQNIKEISKIV